MDWKMGITDNIKEKDFDDIIDKTLNFRYAKGYEYWTKKNKKHNLGLTEFEIHNKVEEYVDRHKDSQLVTDAICEYSMDLFRKERDYN